MQTIIFEIKKRKKLLKNIFLIAVIVIVFTELLSISKTISIDQVKESFAGIAIYKIVLMALMGCLAVLPMTAMTLS